MDSDVEELRRKILKKVDRHSVFNLQTLDTRNRKQHLAPSGIDRECWLQMRGMNSKASLIGEVGSRQDVWKFVIKLDKLTKKYAGESFVDSKFDDGLHCIVTVIIFH